MLRNKIIEVNFNVVEIVKAKDCQKAAFANNVELIIFSTKMKRNCLY
jgi:hypothetical protein